MRRPLRYCPAGIPVHIIQRGVNRCRCFLDDDDMAAYIRILADGATNHDVDVHAWVLMPNHVHLLVTPSGDGCASLMMQHLGRNYVRLYNRRHSRTGTLWEGRFRSSLIQSDRYLLACQRYIELNPVRAGIVTSPAEYHWSSYHSNALGMSSGLIKPHETYLSLGEDPSRRQAVYRDLFDEALSKELVDSIRVATNKGLVIGNEEFKRLVEESSGQSARLLKPGPKVRSRQ